MLLSNIITIVNGTGITLELAIPIKSALKI